MSTVVIHAESSPRDRIGERERYHTLRDVLTRSLRSALSFFAARAKSVIWIDRGLIKQDGPTLDVVFAYDATFAGQLEVDGLGKQDLGRGIQFVKKLLVEH